MRIKKISGTAVLNGNVVDNVFGNSKENAPSQNSINNVFIYSTEEKRIGTWVDGKPLYRKVFILSNINDGLYDFDISNFNFDYLDIETAKCSYINSSGVKFGFFNNYINTGSNESDMFRVFERGNVIRIIQGNPQTSSSNTNKEIMLVFKYTKTTD